MNSSLDAYRRKRDFKRTSEPTGGQRAADGNRFVVHKHAATADHYDLRLQLGDVLKCWAVPKGPSLDPEDKRLAVETEDHPVEYADFEGVIPQGQYGAGPMIIWDEGSWAPMGDARESLEKGQFKFRLVGSKLQGGWMLTRLKPRKGERQPNWLLFKERDAAARQSGDILEERPESARSGRAIEDLTPAPTPVPGGVLRPGALKDSVRSPLPRSVEPQLASATDAPPAGDDWLHEIKFDGYRTVARLEGGDVRLQTRGGLDWTRRYGDLGAEVARISCKSAILDGEIVVLDGRGVSRFELLQDALRNAASGAIVYFVFDLLHLNGWDLRGVPLVKRKELLWRLIGPLVDGRSAIQYSDSVRGNGEAFFERAAELDLEGVVSKRANGPYRSGRGGDWLKAKAFKIGAFPIVGYTTSRAAGGLAALAVGEWVDGALVYRGKVGTGFDQAVARQLLDRLESLEAVPPPDGAPKAVNGVPPVLTAQVHYANRTSGGALRHPVFRGLRELQLSSTRTGRRKRIIGDADLANIWVTNPQRRLFGRSGPTKLDIATYYAAVGDFMLPNVLERPVSLLRCPSGKVEDCFYQRHPFTGMPEGIGRFTARSEEGSPDYVFIADAGGYLALAQFGVVELHAWGCLHTDLERPDRIVLDLDPGDDVPWREVVDAAVHLRTELEKRNLVPFVKTSGGKGIHVVVPIRPALAWSSVHERCAGLAESIAQAAPETFITRMAKRLRKGRIFIDIHRNARSATAVAAYSLRARPHLPVSTPLTWQDLESVDAPQDLNYSTVPGLLETSGDPWADMQRFSRPMPG